MSEGAGLKACGITYQVEDRDVPMAVWAPLSSEDNNYRFIRILLQIFHSGLLELIFGLTFRKDLRCLIFCGYISLNRLAVFPDL